MTTGHAEKSLFPSINLRSWQGVVLGVFVLAAFGLVAFVTFQPIQVLPRVQLAPGFSLIDQDGNQLTNEDLRGHFVVYNFTYSGCRAPDCPQNDLILREVQQRLGELDSVETPISLVTISFDPEHDTPEVLQAYAQSLDADTEQWHFVTGDPTMLKAIIGGGFEVYYNQEEDGSWTFSPTMVLVDGWGIVRAIYHTRTVTPDPDRILRHFEVLEEEVRNSKGVARIGYEAAHLFLCYAS